MSGQVLTIEADSVEAARAQAKGKVPSGAYLFSEMIIRDGKEQTVKGVANTVEEALAQARARVPSGTEIAKECTRIVPSESTIRVEAANEQTAMAEMKQKSSNTATFSDVELVSQAKKGILGIGRRPNVYQARVCQPAVVEVLFKTRAKLQLEVGELPASGFCQFCGKSEARQYDWEEPTPGHYEGETVRYFCGRSSLSSLCRAKMGNLEIEYSLHKDLRGVASSLALDAAMKGDRAGVSAVLKATPPGAEPLSSAVHCWSCGKGLAPLSAVCVHCQKKQKLKRL